MNVMPIRPAALSLLLVALWVTPAVAQNCPRPLGILDSLLVQGRRLEVIDAQRFVVERRGQPVSMNIGDPLCEADRMATQPDTTAKLLVGPATGPRHELTVLSGATVILQTVNRVELLLGRLIGAVQGQFDVVMPFARLAATGTEFEVEVKDNEYQIEQLEGETHLTGSGTTAMVLTRLMQGVSVIPGPTAIDEMDQSRCQALIANANRIDIAARPPIPSQNVIRQFDAGAAAATYQVARQAAICGNDAAAAETVGRVLVDWERPQQALEKLEPGAASASPEDHVATGRALLMRGESQLSIAQFQAAFSQAGASTGISTGMGDAERDLGLAAIKAGPVEDAERRFDAARIHYLKALELAARDDERGVILVDLGDLALLRIKLDANTAEARMTEAKAYYERARRFGDPPHARLSLARLSVLRAQLIPTQQVDASAGSIGEVLTINIALALMADQLRKPHWRQARRELEELTASLPGFAPAQELLGEVLGASGGRDDARERLMLAIAADPGNTSAYPAYARTLSGGKKAMYEAAYQLVEVPAVRQLTKTRHDILFPATENVTIPPAPLTSDAARLGFTRPGLTQQTVNLTNRSNAAATIATVNITGSNPNAFRVVSNDCGQAPIAPTAGCRMVIEFTAESTGKYRATLELSFGGGGMTREISLHGEVRKPSQGEGEGAIIL